MDRKNITACTLIVIITLIAVLLITDSTSSIYMPHDVTILSESSTHEKSAYDKSDAPWSKDELKRKDATWNGDVNIQLKKGGVNINGAQRENPMTATRSNAPLLAQQESHHSVSSGGGMMGGGGSTTFRGVRPPESGMTIHTPRMGGFGNIMPWHKHKKASTEEETLVETGNINAAPATHPEEPWGTPIGDSAIPLFIISAAWIVIKAIKRR